MMSVAPLDDALFLEDLEGSIFEGFDEAGRKVYCCPRCSYRSTHGRADIKKHLEARHMEAQRVCTICSKVCKNIHALKKHQQRNHRD